MNEITVTSDNFQEEVLNSDKPVILDFWASWCGPCKMIAPIIEELANEYSGRIKVGKVNVDEEAELSAAFKVASIPMIVLMEHGEVKAKSIGYSEKDELKSTLGI